MGCSVTFSSIRASAGSPSSTITSQSCIHVVSTSPGATPTTTKGKLARRSPGMSLGARSSSRTFTAPLRSGAMLLRSSSRSAPVLRSSRMARRYPAPVDDSPVDRWAASGAMTLTGLPDLPLGPPDGLVQGIDQLAGPFPGLDSLALLGERAALMGLWRRGTTSCGGSCRLLPAARGWVAVSLPRAADMEVVPAWLELDVAPETVPETWSAVADTLVRRDADEVVARARCWDSPWRASARRPGQQPWCVSHSDRDRHGSQPAAWSSTSPRCGPARSAATCWRARGRPWSRWSQRDDRTARAAAHASSSTS